MVNFQTQAKKKQRPWLQVYSLWNDTSEKQKTEQTPDGPTDVAVSTPPLPVTAPSRPGAQLRVATLPPACPQLGPADVPVPPATLLPGAAPCGAHTRQGHGHHVEPQNTPSVLGPERAGGSFPPSTSQLPETPAMTPGFKVALVKLSSVCWDTNDLGRELSSVTGPGMQRNW